MRRWRKPLNQYPISLEVDKLAGQVSALESVISKGGKVAEKTLLNLIELLMNQLLKLDGITADGDVKLQRKMQVKRVQKYVETLDVLKIKNSTAGTNENGDAKQVQEPPASQRQEHIISNGHMNAASPNQHDRYQPPFTDANRKKGKKKESVRIQSFFFSF
ncbi:putative BAG domain-containing protein [Helianthus annuus]|nr:putative BAG domain-containing protein [Helianthus annuus]